MDKRVTREDGTALAEVVVEAALGLRRLGFAFGALFVGHRAEDGATEFALLFRDGMPQPERMQLLEDLQKTLDASKETFQV